MTPLVVGSGFLGAVIGRRCPDSSHTSRNPAARPADRRWLRFDLDDSSTWHALDGLAADAVVVAAPLRKEHDLEGIWRRLAAINRRVIVVGTTSAFAAATTVTDASPIDTGNPRAVAEEHLRSRGATVLHAAGIYGPGRNPLDWVRRGRIANAGKLVNLVHVEDLARACLFLGDHFKAGLRVVCADGTPRRWRDIIAAAVAHRWIVEPHLPDEEDPRSKRVLPRGLIERGFRFEHPDVIEELGRLEGCT